MAIWTSSTDLKYLLQLVIIGHRFKDFYNMVYVEEILITYIEK